MNWLKIDSVSRLIEPKYRCGVNIFIANMGERVLTYFIIDIFSKTVDMLIEIYRKY